MLIIYQSAKGRVEFMNFTRQAALGFHWSAEFLINLWIIQLKVMYTIGNFQKYFCWNIKCNGDYQNVIYLFILVLQLIFLLNLKAGFVITGRRHIVPSRYSVWTAVSSRK